MVLPFGWHDGYSIYEIEGAQQIYGVRFPPDFIELLTSRHPSLGYDWTCDNTHLKTAFEWPFEGFLFDVEANWLWPDEWGIRPHTAEQRATRLREILSNAPRLIPVFGHRYIPESPRESGNPVFSVYQADIIHYGANLADYLDREFFDGMHRPWPEDIKHIDFWSSFIDFRY